MNKTRRTLAMTLMLPTLAVLAACDGDLSDGPEVPAGYSEPAPVEAQPEPGPEPSTPVADERVDPVADLVAFADLDGNGDGGISQAELMPEQMLYKHFGAADSNADGMLSETEVAAHRAAMGIEP